MSRPRGALSEQSRKVTGYGKIEVLHSALAVWGSPISGHWSLRSCCCRTLREFGPRQVSPLVCDPDLPIQQLAHQYFLLCQREPPIGIMDLKYSIAPRHRPIVLDDLVLLIRQHVIEFHSPRNISMKIRRRFRLQTTAGLLWTRAESVRSRC